MAEPRFEPWLDRTLSSCFFLPGRHMPSRLSKQSGNLNQLNLRLPVYMFQNLLRHNEQNVWGPMQGDAGFTGIRHNHTAKRIISKSESLGRAGANCSYGKLEADLITPWIIPKGVLSPPFFIHTLKLKRKLKMYWSSLILARSEMGNQMSFQDGLKVL